MAGGVLIYTHIGGYWFESRCCARAIFFVGFWCCGAQVAARAKRRVVRGRTGGSCEFGGWPRVAYFVPIFPDACFAVYNALGKREGQKYGFRPRCTGRAPERSPKQKTPVLASQALASDSFPRIFQVRPARKLRLTDPKCTSAASQISLTRLKLPKMAVFVTNSPQRAFSRNWSRQPVGLDLKHRVRANIGCEMWLRSRVASPPKGTFWP